jgi:hypothetical protein
MKVPLSPGLPLFLLSLGLLLAAPPAAAQDAAAPGAATSCLSCHGNEDLIGDPEMVQIVEDFQKDTHGDVGLSCHDCHGGNPDPALAEDMLAAMDPDYAANPYRGAPTRTEVPDFCGRCHSDPTFMKRYRPDARVDQEREYWTSHHGKALEAGDTKVATCIDCHGVHGITGPEDPDSPVYPTRVAETCGRCHADPEHMAGYTLPDGRPLPVDQLSRWKRSVHAAAMIQREDLSAPTCNDCHGNHGATPPGLDSVAFVCGQCHGREASLFRASSKREGFEEHNEMLGGEGSCSDCHAEPEPQAALTTLHAFSECATCHGNHAVVRPTVALLAPLPETPCALCHEGPEALTEAGLEEPRKVQHSYEQQRDALLQAARAEGLEGEDLFNRLVDEIRTLPQHTLEGSAAAGDGEPKLRPELSRLFEKFRIGKTYFTYPDPVTGEPVRQKVVRCTDCHGDEPQLAESPRGLETAREFLGEMQQLTVLTARAERTSLRARRGGVEVRDALLDLDKAVDAQIELEVLIHTFSSAEGGKFQKKHQEGMEHARTAMEKGREALHELSFRRRGLAVSLIIIVLVLIGLALKIRSLPAS